MRSLLIAACFLALMATNAFSTLAFSTTDLGGGLFRYDITLNNPLSQPVSGLNIINANSLFGLDAASVIKSPPGWGFFAPIPGVIDELNYFSKDPVFDVSVGGSRSGFGFESFTDPSHLASLRYDLIGGSSGTQVPEPHDEILLGGSAFISIALYGLRRRPRIPGRRSRAANRAGVRHYASAMILR
jgi:hypothetical protein